MFKGEGEGNIYSRFTNPNTTELINKVCALEEAEAGVCAASGMSAIFNTLIAHLVAGDEVVASNSLFGNTTYILQHILPSWGISCKFVGLTDHEAWQSSITDQTKMVLIETPSNPGLEMINISWLSGLCKAHNAILAVDNCFATPILQKPMLLGADLSIHSATKWMDGQGRVLGGLVVGHERYVTRSTLSWSARYCANAKAFSQCLCILISSVSMLLDSIHALNGLMHGPVLRRKS